MVSLQAVELNDTRALLLSHAPRLVAGFNHHLNSSCSKMSGPIFAWSNDNPRFLGCKRRPWFITILNASAITSDTLINQPIVTCEVPNSVTSIEFVKELGTILWNSWCSEYRSQRTWMRRTIRHSCVAISWEFIPGKLIIINGASCPRLKCCPAAIHVEVCITSIVFSILSRYLVTNLIYFWAPRLLASLADIIWEKVACCRFIADIFKLTTATIKVFIAAIF
jgi:hypothetical protein